METATSSAPHSPCPLVHDSAPACTCGGIHLGPYAGSHLPGCLKLAGRRGITEAEHRLMRHCDMFGSDGWPIRKQGRTWTWGTDGVPGPPVVFKTKREAAASFQAFMGILRDAVAGKI